MDVTFTVSLVVGAVSIILAVLAIWLSIQSERRSTENYDRTKDILSEISEKAAVIEGTVSNTQEKLVDTVTAIAKPKEETQDEMIAKVLLPSMVQNPQMLEKLIELSEQQGAKQPGGGNNPKRKRRSSSRRG